MRSVASTSRNLLVATALILTASLANGQAAQFKDFLLRNRLQNSPMPRSYAVDPTDYFEKVPASQKLQNYKTNHYIPQCQNKSVPPADMDAYEFQTETWLTTLGTDIYDAGVWCMATTLLGEGKNCTYYLENVLIADKTIQFNNIRGDAPCNGIAYDGKCNELYDTCGFCYGLQAQTLTSNNAYFFRMISDYWAIQGTVDARCPELNMLWTWNDYRPILGENAWAQLLSPAQVAMMNANFKAAEIPDSAPLFKLGVPFLTALNTMKIADLGGYFYAPWNTWTGFSHASEEVGATFSVENQGSLLAGLEALQYILTNKPTSQYANLLPQVTTMADDLRNFILSAYSSELGFFRQGGTYHRGNKSISWTQEGQPNFAVDCQTWIGAVLGTALIDSKFGDLAAYNIWQKVKQYAGWQDDNGMFMGVGYTYTNISGSVFSGEWTIGAINWLNVMVEDSGYNATIIGNLQNDINMMNFGLETYLFTSTKINNSTLQYNSVKYSNIRYYIPFGWFANPLPATASTAWAVLSMSNYNPFNVNNGSFARYPQAKQ